jgi:hypothetical protein
MAESRRDAAVAGLLGLAAFAVYLMTLAPTVLPGDSGEFQFAAPLAGLAHPTGYPLYLLLGRIWTSLVPLGDMAYRMNLLSAVFAALAVAACYTLARKSGVGMMAAAIAALTLAVSRTFWSQAVRAEVYALNSMFAIVLLALALSQGRPGEELPNTGGGTASAGSYALFFTLGLALAHHRTSILLIPALLVLAWPGLACPSWDQRPTPQRIALSLLALCLPLLLYLYIPLRAAATPYLRLPVGGGPELILYSNTFSDWVAMVAGSVFRGSLTAPESMDLASRLAMAGDLLRQQAGLAGMALAIVGFIAALRRPRLALGLLMAYGAVAGFCLLYNIGDIADFFTPAYIIVCLWIGLGVQWLADTMQRVAKAPGRLAVLIVAILLPLTLLLRTWPSLDMSKQTTTRSAWATLLRDPFPQGATLVSNDRDEMTPLWYLHYMEGMRPDVVGLFPKITTDASLSSFGGMLDWLLARGQQPYLIKAMPGLDVKYAIQSSSAMTQVIGLAAPAPLQPKRTTPASLAGQVRLIGADGGESVSAGGVLTVTLYWTPLAPMKRDYQSFVQLLDTAGERVAGGDHRPGGVYYPTSAWAAGDTLADRHTIALPQALPPGQYHLVTGMYEYPSFARLLVDGSTETTIDLGVVQIR